MHKKAKHEVLPEMWKDARDFLFKWLYFNGELPLDAPPFPVPNSNL